jgi:hypothetical protein
VVKLKVGVTIGRGSEWIDQILWSSGLNQNIVYMTMLLQRLPEVEQVFIIDCSEAKTPHPLAEWCGVASISQQTAASTVNLIIELGSRTDQTMAKMFRDQGGKLVSYMAGNAAIMNFEAVAGKTANGEVNSGVEFDATWITPQHWETNRAWSQITRAPITEIVPHIWEPVCLEAAVKQSKHRYFWHDRDLSKGYRVGTLVPNINTVKTFHIPLLSVEEAYRKAPHLIDRMLLFNTEKLAGLPHFEEFIAATSLARDKKVFSEGRWMTTNVIGTFIDAVVEHQWQNNLNYLYWDVLYSGHPFIHNSTEIDSAGYYYQEFDSQDGGRVIVDALSRHAGRAKEARRDAIDYLWRFRVDNPVVQARHSELIEQVMG